MTAIWHVIATQYDLKQCKTSNVYYYKEQKKAALSLAYLLNFFYP